MSDEHGTGELRTELDAGVLRLVINREDERN